MKVDALAQTQLMLAQAISALAKDVEQSIGLQLSPITYAALPTPAKIGMLVYLGDSNRNGYGQNITASGPYTVLALFDGTNWVVH